MSPLKAQILSPDNTKDLAILHARCFDAAWSADFFKEKLLNPYVIGLGVYNLETYDLTSAILLQGVMPELEVLTIMTNPADQNTGYAGYLLSFASDYARKSGYEYLYLDVAADNLIALAMYYNSDFEEVSRRYKYYRHLNGSSIDAIVMRKSLL